MHMPANEQKPYAGVKRSQSARGGLSREQVRDQAYIKQYNIQTVLNLLRKSQPVSRTDIARITGMSPTSITRIVTALINQNLIYETTGEQRSGRGRKATNLRLNDGSLFSAGVHIERSAIRLCVSNMVGDVLYSGETLIDGDRSPECMAREARRLLDRMPAEVLGEGRIGAVGVCLPGMVDHRSGMVKKSGPLEWEGVNAAEVFSGEFDVPVCIENDVKACLIGEKMGMDIPDDADTAYILVSTGLGVALTSGGALIRGADNEAGEISRIPLKLNPGEDDYLGMYLAEKNLVKRAQRFDPSVRNVDSILWAKKQGQRWAIDQLQDFGGYLRLLMTLIDRICNPAVIVLGGPIFKKLAAQNDDVLRVLLKDKHVRLGAQYEISCMTGAAMVAMQSAILNMIGNNIE